MGALVTFTVSQHAQYKNPETEATEKKNSHHSFYYLHLDLHVKMSSVVKAYGKFKRCMTWTKLLRGKPGDGVLSMITG